MANISGQRNIRYPTITLMNRHKPTSLSTNSGRRVSKRQIHRIEIFERRRNSNQHLTSLILPRKYEGYLQSIDRNVKPVWLPSGDVLRIHQNSSDERELHIVSRIHLVHPVTITQDSTRMSITSRVGNECSRHNFRHPSSEYTYAQHVSITYI